MTDRETNRRSGRAQYSQWLTLTAYPMADLLRRPFRILPLTAEYRKLLHCMRTFYSENGRQIFDNGQRRLWHCRTCGWWREWEMLSCCVCGAHRDTAAAPVHASVLARVTPRG